MARPIKLTPELQQRIGDYIARGLPYVMASASFGITYQTFNEWIKKGKNLKIGCVSRFLHLHTKTEC